MKDIKDEEPMKDDPMHEYFSNKNMEIRMKTEVVYPTYKGQYAQNRYNIPPGYRWDGVDRSNGFEDKIVLRANRMKAEESAAYRINAEMAD